MAKTNRQLMEDALEASLDALALQQAEIREDDAALRVKRSAADEARADARRLRMAVFALDGDDTKTVADADAENDKVLQRLEAGE